MGVELTLHSASWSNNDRVVTKGQQLAQEVIETDRALGLVARMFIAIANADVTIVALAEEEAVLASSYNISGLTLEGGPDYGFAYTFRRGPDPFDAWTIPMVVFALGTVHRRACLPDVADFIAMKNQEAHDARKSAMKEALGYYADRNFWDNNRLFGCWPECELGASPWTPACNALAGYPVKPLADAKAQMERRRIMVRGFGPA